MASGTDDPPCKWRRILPDESKLVHILSRRTSFEQIELQAKLQNYFLGSNKSNINQWFFCAVRSTGSLASSESFYSRNFCASECKRLVNGSCVVASFSFLVFNKQGLLCFGRGKKKILTTLRPQYPKKSYHHPELSTMRPNEFGLAQTRSRQGLPLVVKGISFGSVPKRNRWQEMGVV